MRDESRVSAWATVAAAALAASLSIPGPASAQRLTGSAEVNYQSVDQVRSTAPTLESWVKTFRMNYADQLPGDVSLSSQLQFSEQTIVGRPDRFRNPQGRLRLAHRYWGITSAYQPNETRDSQGLTTEQQSLSFTGYVQKPGLPSLAGSWIRSHLNANERTPGSATITRGLSALYNLPRAGFHAAYGDRFLDLPSDPHPRSIENNLSLGANTQFQIGKAPMALRYDYAQSRANPSGTREQRSWVHTAGANTSYQFTTKTSSSLSYTYRRTTGRSSGPLEDHNGALSLAHMLSRAVQASAGAGVRSVLFAGRQQTESFLAANLTAQGQVRQGWRASATAGRSINWLPGVKARPADSFQSNTSMQLARGLSARADLGVSASRATGPSDTASAAKQKAVQAGAGLTARPLRTVFLDGSVNRSRSGESLFRGGTTATAYTTTLRLTPSPQFSVTGSWGLSRGVGATGTSAQTSAQWAVSPSLQITGAYSRSRQELVAAGSPRSLQESYAGSLVMALAWDLRASVRYSHTNPRQASEVRSFSAAMSRNFGGR